LLRRVRFTVRRQCDEIATPLAHGGIGADLLGWNGSFPSEPVASNPLREVRSPRGPLAQGSDLPLGSDIYKSSFAQWKEPMDLNVMLTPAEAALPLRCSIDYVWKLCREERLAHMRKSNKILIPRQSITDYIAASLVGGGA
jgi:hypothetical protein